MARLSPPPLLLLLLAAALASLATPAAAIATSAVFHGAPYNFTVPNDIHLSALGSACASAPCSYTFNITCDVDHSGVAYTPFFTTGPLSTFAATVTLSPKSGNPADINTTGMTSSWTCNVELLVSDNSGDSETAETTLTINPQPPACVGQPRAGLIIVLNGQNVTLPNMQVYGTATVGTGCAERKGFRAYLMSLGSAKTKPLPKTTTKLSVWPKATMYDAHGHELKAILTPAYTNRAYYSGCPCTSPKNNPAYCDPIPDVFEELSTDQTKSGTTVFISSLISSVKTDGPLGRRYRFSYGLQSLGTGLSCTYPAGSAPSYQLCVVTKPTGGATASCELYSNSGIDRQADV